MRPRYLPDLSGAEAMMSSTNQKARTEHLGRASQPPPVHPRLEVGGAMLRAIQRTPGRSGCCVPWNIFRPAEIGRTEYARCNTYRLCAHFRPDGTAQAGQWEKQLSCGRGSI